MATITRLDDYRKTPRGPVQHEIAMDPDKARRMREEAERFQAACRAEFMRRCAELKGER